MLWEDAHWADPSSLELLDRVVGQIVGLPVLLVISFRPEFIPPWIDRAGVRLITLNRLDRQETATLAAQVSSGSVLTQTMLDSIIAQTDGVPLFIEELTKSVLETARDGRSVPPMVPATLQASLMARIDRLGPAAKDVAQTGAAIGREFGQELLASVTDLPEAQRLEALNRLTNAGLLFVRGTSPEASYMFKHALVQDAAYGTLLRSRRRMLHTRIVTTLEGRSPEIAMAQPALLAQHCDAAGLTEKAVGYWLRAGQQADARSAVVEAVAQFRKGLEALADLPDGPRRQQLELDLQTSLGWTLTATAGHSAAEANERLARARTLAEALGRPDHLMRLMIGQVWFHLNRSEHRHALSLGEQLEQILETQNDVSLQLRARNAQGGARFCLGEFVVARAVLERCVGLALPAQRAIVSNDPCVAARNWLGLTLAYLGYIDQARLWMDEALSEARRLRHAHTLAHALVSANWFDSLTRWPKAHVEESLALTSEHGLQHFWGLALAFRGQSLIGRGQAQEGLAQFNQGLAKLQATDQVCLMPMLLTLRAEAHVVLGQPAETLNCLAEAARIVETTEERFSEAELHRVWGDSVNAVGDPTGAERHYRQAIAVAERQSAKLLQLKASTSLAQLLRDQGKRTEAGGLLGPIYNWFTEGFGAPDLKDARALLDQLA